MPVSSNNGSSNERILYSHHKALDAILDLGAIPERLFRVFYPLWRVQVDGHQRIATDFEELEWFMERGIHDIGITSLEALASFFGLEERFVRSLVSFLQHIEHIKGDDNHLELTQLGLESVRARIRYQEQRTSAYLYFDGLGSRPLTKKHYLIPVYEDISVNQRFWAFYPFNHQWNESAVDNLMSQPNRDAYNLPDEVTQIELVGREPIYMPAYVIQRREDKQLHLPEFLVFSRIQGLRDDVLEKAINTESTALRSLAQTRQNNLGQSIAEVLSEKTLKLDDWHFNQQGAMGYQVTVNAHVIVDDTYLFDDDKNHIGLTFRDIGRYLTIYDWCVWVTCDEPDIRVKAATQQILEWLQYATKAPSLDDIEKQLTTIQKRMDIEDLSLETIIDQALELGLSRALDRLEILEQS
jgi:hypothetical protein